MVYSKAFHLSPKARQASTVGDIVNHMSIDVDRLMNLVPYLHMVWSGPVQVIVSIIMLYFVVSWSVFAGVFVMLITIPINGFVAKKVLALEFTSDF
jgi:ATP-binding cassette, subfamily C (CFTR/MRP), member 1